MTIGPLRRIVATDESGFYVRFTLECGHVSLKYPYKFKDHLPYPRRRRCSSGCVLNTQRQEAETGTDGSSRREVRAHGPMRHLRTEGEQNMARAKTATKPKGKGGKGKSKGKSPSTAEPTAQNGRSPVSDKEIAVKLVNFMREQDGPVSMDKAARSTGVDWFKVKELFQSNPRLFAPTSETRYARYTLTDAAKKVAVK